MLIRDVLLALLTSAIWGFGFALILRRVLKFLSAWDQRQKDREIERLIASSGGRITDELERRIVERLVASDWSIRR
jgi:hypothetical protein